MKTRNFHPFWVILGLVAYSCLPGCERQKAQERVLSAFNPPAVSVTNGQAAVLRLTNGYAVVIPKYIRHNEISYRVYFNGFDGRFADSATPPQEGSVGAGRQIEIEGIRVYLGYGGENVTGILLDFGDASTGIAWFPTNDLEAIDASRITFRRGTPLNPDDLLKASGMDRIAPKPK